MKDNESHCMNDACVTLQELRCIVSAFVKEREWEQFHVPKNLSMNIAAEAAELMECFLWCDTQDSMDIVGKKRAEVEDEVADVLISLLCFANATGIDISSAVDRKIAKNAQKYPVEKAKGRAVKYSEL